MPEIEDNPARTASMNALLSAPRPAQTAQQPVAAPAARWINIQQLVGRCMGNLELADRLIWRFCERLSSTVGEIEAAAAEADLAKLHAVAHRLKGEAGNMGAESLSRLAGRTEEYAEMGFTSETLAAAKELLKGCDFFQEQAAAFRELAGQRRDD